MRLILVLCALVLLSATCSQRLSKNLDFTFIIAGCFDYDTISIVINDIQFVNSCIVKSEFSSGLTGLDIYQDNDSLWLLNQGEKVGIERMEIENELDISIIANHDSLSEKVNLKKGKVIVLEYCNWRQDDGSLNRRLRITQFKKQVIFE